MSEEPVISCDNPYHYRAWYENGNFVIEVHEAAQCLILPENGLYAYNTDEYILRVTLDPEFIERIKNVRTILIDDIIPATGSDIANVAFPIEWGYVTIMENTRWYNGSPEFFRLIVYEDMLWLRVYNKHGLDYVEMELPFPNEVLHKDS